MIELTDSHVFLEQFSSADFERAKAQLLRRFALFEGILVSHDGKMVLTSADLPKIRDNALELLEKAGRSGFESEQLKVLTVMIYLLIGVRDVTLSQRPPPAEAGGAGNYALESQAIRNALLHSAGHFPWGEIKRLATEYNALVARQRADGLAEPVDAPTRTWQLKSKDGLSFVLRSDGPRLVCILRDRPAAAASAPPRPLPARSPWATIPSTPVVVTGEGAKTLAETLRLTPSVHGHRIAVASYLGRGRPQNEDAAVILPAHDRVVVIDAMGGYKNGLPARDLFLRGLLETPADIEQAVTSARGAYEREGLKRGGVCLMDARMTTHDGARVVEMAQAGDVHLALYDGHGTVMYESVDEALGHRVMNAIVSQSFTDANRRNGWERFGRLTRHRVPFASGWRLAIYSDGVGNHYSATELGTLLLAAPLKEAIARLSAGIDARMAAEGAYCDNCSIAVVELV